MIYKSTVLLLLVTLFISLPLITDQRKSGYLPVVLVAGLNADNIDMNPLHDLISKYLPDTYVKNIKIGHEKCTFFWNIYSQTNEFIEAMHSDCKLRHGCNVIAFSQGGLTARYYIECHNMPRVYNYIAFATPQKGVYGAPGTLDKKYTWLNTCDPYISDILYLSFFQRYSSIAGYWHDPLKHEKYVACCRFLPYLNNEKDHCHTDLFKENLTKLHNMVLIQPLCDTVIEPVQSTHFGFYTQGTDDTIESLFESEEFQKDTLGLRTLFQAGKLHLRQVNGDHYDAVLNEENFVHNILPFLKSPTIDEVTD